MVRRITHELHPAILENLGLIPALELSLVTFQRRVNIKTVSTFSVEGLNFDPEFSINIYRILQEALTNIVKQVFSPL